MSIVTLATDLDGTLLPLDNKVKSFNALTEIDRRHKLNSSLQLVFVTGRHLSSVLKLYDKFPLPIPDLIICDVGTTIYRYNDNCWVREDRYSNHLNSLIEDKNREAVVTSLSVILGLNLQEDEKQGKFKVSYYVNKNMLSSVVEKIEDLILIKKLPYNVVHSIDPFTGDGLIDLLPKGVTKKYALLWLVEKKVINEDTLCYAGDSGNDREVFLSDIKSIVVNNAPSDLKNEIKKECINLENVFFASKKSVEGVLEGCDFFGWK